MALIPMSRPNIDRIIDRDYEAYTDRLWEEANRQYGKCSLCEHYVSAYGNVPTYCNKDRIEELDDEEFQEKLPDYIIYDPDDACEDYEYNIGLDTEDDY